MTGYARAQGSDERRRWVWEARSVNGRNLEVRCRVPQGFERLENPARTAVSGRFKRGNVNLTLTVTSEQQGKPLRINRALLAELAALVEEVRKTTGAAPPSADGLLRVRGVIEEQDERVETEAELSVLDKALQASLDEVLSALASARAMPCAVGSNVVSSMPSCVTSAIVVVPHGVISSNPPSPWMISARWMPRIRITSAIGSTRSGRATPMIWNGVCTGLASGPSRFMIVGTASSRRTGPACRMAGWWAGA